MPTRGTLEPANHHRGVIFVGVYMELLSTSVPTHDALEMAREQLNAADLSQDLPVLIGVSTTFLVHKKKKFYRQIESAAMGSLL
jgi:hypothetical protein